jgi:hypothetical protein
VVAAGAAGAAAGVEVSGLLLQAVSTSAAARALRASFVFIDESPENLRKTNLKEERKPVCRGPEAPETRIL